MNVVFLDYDGVVNTPQWKQEHGQWKCDYNSPSDNAVNDVQAVQWVSEFCEKYGYDIVVTSTWRTHDNYKECLLNGGLRAGIKILGKTPWFPELCREDEIQAWMNEHNDVENYLIFDDESNMEQHLSRLIPCKTSIGFRMEEFEKAAELHRQFLLEQRRINLAEKIYAEGAVK